MDTRSVEHHARRLAANWKAAPSLEVVRSTQELPGGGFGDVAGLYAPRARQAYLVAEAHLARAVAATTAHELVGHAAVRELLGRRAWTSLMAAVQAGADAGDERVRAARDFVRWAYVDEQQQRYLSRVSESDEVVAAFAEALIDYRTGRLRARSPMVSLWRAATGHVAREVLLLDRPADYEEIEGVLLAAEHRLRHGGLLWGLAGRCYAGAVTTPKPMGPSRPARDLAESQWLLDEERRRQESGQGLKAAVMSLGGIALLVAGVAGMAYGVLQMLGVISQ